MQATTVRLSDVITSDRMDAAFHIVAAAQRERVERLRALLNEDEARSIANELPSRILSMRVDGRQVLEPLARGKTTGSLTTNQMVRIIAEYPHLVLAVLFEHVGTAIEDIRTETTELEKRISALERLRASVA